MSPGIMGLRWFRRKSKAKFRCSLCGKTAGVVELLPRGHAESLSKSETICISGFIGRERVVVPEAGVPELRAILVRGDASKLYEFEGLWAPSWCPTCAAVYCIAHWTVVPEYDEGFFDCSHGFCPKGHKRLIED